MKKILYTVFAICVLVSFYLLLTRHLRVPLVPVSELPSETPLRKSAVAPISQAGTNSSLVTDSVNRYGRYAGLPAAELWTMKPKMYKMQEYPPINEDGIHMWQWRRAMEKADPRFKRKMTIDFFGKIVDQTNAPVDDVEVSCERLAVGGESGIIHTRYRSDTNGLFSITGVQGKSMTITVYKEGYQTVPDSSSQSFEYCDFFEHNFHTPNPSTPVMFKLWKYTAPEPMYSWRITGVMKCDGAQLWLDFLNGKVNPTGDVGFSLVRGSTVPGYLQQEYSITIHAAKGGGVVVIPGECECRMYEAPADGYQPFVKIVQTNDVSYKVTKILNIYSRTSEGKYAAVQAQINQYNEPSAGFRASVYYNPSGSRNLEYDSNKRIIERR